jgi:predicted RNase H-like HicB family nuclease
MMFSDKGKGCHQAVRRRWLASGPNNMRYVVIVEKGENSFGAYAPYLPGCAAAAEIREEVLQLIREAIEFHLEGLAKDGQPLPKPSSIVEYVEVKAV